MASVNIVAEDNGVGLSRDVRLLAAALGELKCDVAVTTIDRLERKRRRSVWARLARKWGGKPSAAPPKRFDLTVMLENIWPERLELSPRNVLIPNPEWFDKHNPPLLKSIDRIWAKTQDALEIFNTLGRPTTFIGFDSEDRFQPDVPSAPSFFHLAGKSLTKGTARLLDLWSAHPKWPTLTVVRSRESESPAPTVNNIVIRQEYLPDSELIRLQNANAFHLCPSETEGWGHYIVEAMGVGAITITVDAAPMNELVHPNRGVLIRCSELGTRRLATTYAFDLGGMVEAVERVAKSTDAERKRMSEAARAWFLENKRGFAARVEAGLNAVL